MPLHTQQRHAAKSDLLISHINLGWLARGKSNAEIAEILGISAATVGKHLEHIYPKLGVENRTAAASFAFAAGSHLNILGEKR